MNRQKLLWVILSVTLLVILVLVGGLWLLRDKSTAPVAEAAREPRVDYDLFEIPLRNTPLPGIQQLDTPPEATEKGDIQKQDFVIGDNARDEEPAVSAKTLTSQPVVRATPAPRKALPKKQTTTTTTARATTPRYTGRQYWIQTGSYKSKSKADSCNAVLIENGLAGHILTKQINDDTFFRVRIGPYTNKNEAEKFLSWIQKINGMEASYIVVNTARN